MQPVTNCRELLVVHAVACKVHVSGLGLAILLNMPFPRQFRHSNQLFVTTQCVQHRPVRQVLNGIIGTIVTTPTRRSTDIATFVKVVVKKLLARSIVGADQLALQQRPCRWRNRRFDAQLRSSRSRYLCRTWHFALLILLVLLG